MSHSNFRLKTQKTVRKPQTGGERVDHHRAAASCMAPSWLGCLLRHHCPDSKGQSEPATLCWHGGDRGTAHSHPPSCSPSSPSMFWRSSTRLPTSWTPTSPRQISRWEAECWAAAEVAAQGGVCLSSADHWQRGTASSTGLSAVLKRCSNTTSKPKPDPLLDGGERPKYCKALQKKGFFSFSRFFTPFRESAAAPSVL